MQQYLVLGLTFIAIMGIIIEIANWIERKVQNKVSEQNNKKLKEITEMCKQIQSRLQNFNDRVLLLKESNIKVLGANRMEIKDEIKETSHFIEESQKMLNGVSQSLERAVNDRNKSGTQGKTLKDELRPNSIQDKQEDFEAHSPSFAIDLKQEENNYKRSNISSNQNQIKEELQELRQSFHQIKIINLKLQRQLKQKYEEIQNAQVELRQLNSEIESRDQQVFQLRQKIQEFEQNQNTPYYSSPQKFRTFGQEENDLIELPISNKPKQQEKLAKTAKAFINIRVQTDAQNVNDIYLQTPSKKLDRNHLSSTNVVNTFNPNSSPKSKSLSELRSQLQFCQLQLNQAYSHQLDLKMQINTLTRQLQDYNRIKEKLYGYEKSVAQMKPLVDDHRNLQKLYQELKKDFEDLTKKYKAMVKNIGDSQVSGSPSEHTPKYKSNIEDHPVVYKPSMSSTPRYQVNVIKEKSPSGSGGKHNSYKLDRLRNGNKSGISPSSVKSDHLIYGMFTDCRFLNDQNRHFIVKIVKRLIEVPNKSRQIYKYDKVHPQNPHEYIDHIPHILLLIQLKNGKVIGAYTQKPFSEDLNKIEKKESFMHGYMENRSFIIDVTEQKVFLNTKQIKTIVYQSDSLIWGNDALVIKNNQPNVVYSNLCNQHSFYWDGFTATQQFLGSKPLRTWETVSAYEIHAIEFL